MMNTDFGQRIKDRTSWWRRIISRWIAEDTETHTPRRNEDVYGHVVDFKQERLEAGGERDLEQEKRET